MRKKVNGGRLACGILAAAVASIFGGLDAETVANVLVTKETGVDLYAVSDTEEWSLVRNICSVSRTFSAIAHSGVIYVSTAGNYDVNSGIVKMYNVRGEHLGDLPTCEFRCDKLAISPDGRYLFSGNGGGSAVANVGCVYRYSFANGTWTKFASNVGNCLRGLAFDSDGNIFVAYRNANVNVYSWDVADSDLPFTSASRKVTGLNWACPLYMHTDGYIYWVGQAGNFGRFLPDGSVKNSYSGDYTGWSYDGLLVLNGKLHFGTMNGTTALWRQKSADTTSTEFEKVLDGFKVHDIAEVKVKPVANMPFTGSSGSAVLSGDYPVWPQGGACGGATGVDGSCLCLTGGYARAELANSRSMIPVTDDFAVTFWAGMPATGSATGGRILLSNDFGQDGSFSLMADPDGGHLNKLGLKFTPDVSSTPVTLATEAVIADGNWHHVAVVRREGTSLELWLDGVRTGTVAVAASDAVSQEWNWHLGSSGDETEGFSGPGAFIDELSVYDGTIPLPGQLPGMAAKYSPGALPSVPAPSAAEPSAMPAAYGTEIAHADANDAPLANPNIIKASDGSFWVASGRANGQAAADASTRFWRSVDGGATWTSNAAPALAASGVSLFESGNTLCAIGMKAEDGLHACAVWALSGGEWDEKSSYPSSEPLLAGAGSSAVVNGRIGKPVAFLSTPYSTSHHFGYISFAVDGTSFSSPVLTTNNVAELNSSYNTLVDAIPGIAIEVPEQLGTIDANVAVLSPLVDGDRTDVASVRGTERICRMLIHSETLGAVRKDSYGFMFRGGAKPFDVKYDSSSGLYWALAVAITNTAEYASRRADTVRNALALYASPDLEEWRPCGVVAVSGDVDATGFNGPTFAIDGDDLVVAVGVSCADGAGGARSTAHNAYIAFRRIANFRTAYEPMKPGRMRMLSCNRYRACIDSAWYDDASGEWYAASRFCSVSGPQNIAAGRDRVYVSYNGGNPTKVYEFSNTGRLLRTLTSPAELGMSGSTVPIALSPDGATLYVAAADALSNNVFKVDIASGNWSLFVYSGKINKPNRLATGPDGSLYVGNYGRTRDADSTLSPDLNYYRVNCFDSAGNWVSNPYTYGSPGVGVSGMAVDGRNLYASCVHGRIQRVNLDTLEKETVSSRHIEAVATVYGVTVFNGRLYSTSTWGWFDSIDLETLESHAAVASRPGTTTSTSALGIVVIDSGWRRGIMLHIR